MKRIVIFISIIAVAIFFFLWLRIGMQKAPPIPAPSITATVPSPTSYTTPLPTLGYTQTNNDSVFNNRIDHPPSLAPSQQTAKQNLINSLPQGQETLFNDSTFQVTYVAPYDVFQVEVLTTNVDLAENNAIAWFLAKGITKESMCNMPVMFYPNFYIDQQLKAQGKEVPPLAKGC